ncbi:MAG: helix-turn-helix domain-containing protein [Oscillospiraceae bacterium]|nr:helix-turn-helix domain-containing protein [Oscillospiraceae bacterium]
MKGFYSIQEFAKITGIETSTLRYYDKIGLFSPAIRNPDNNYRYYSPAQVMSLNFITVLGDLNLPLRTIAELRKERSPVRILQLLDRQEKQMNMEMRILRQKYAIIHTRRELINYGMVVTNGYKAVKGKRMGEGDTIEGVDEVDVDVNAVAVLHRDNKEYILWPRNEYEEGDTFIDPLLAFINQASSRNINLAFPVGGYWDDMDSFMAHPSLPDHFFTIDPMGNSVRKEGFYLIGFNRGYYSEMADLPERMAAFTKEKSLTLTGPVLAMYMFDEICTGDPDRFLVQVCVAVARPKRKAIKEPAWRKNTPATDFA